MDNQKVNLTFVHPTDSEQRLTAAVSRQATAGYLVEQLIGTGFMPPLGAAGRYVLRNGASGVQLHAGTTLAAAGVTDGTEVLVDATMSGAASDDRDVQ